MKSHDCFIAGYLRTARGKGSPRGGFAKVPPVRLLASLQRTFAERWTSAAHHAEDVVIGCATQVNGQGANIARTASLLAGWNPSVMGLTVNRFCTSGLDAVGLAAARVHSGEAQLMVAGGIEVTSQVPIFADNGALYGDPDVARALRTVHMGIAADAVATLEDVEREAIDTYALNTREKAMRAWEDGRARASVVRVEGLEEDEFLNYMPTAGECAALPPAFTELGATQDAIVLERYPSLRRVAHRHTKATSPAPADAAALMLLASGPALRTHQLAPRARVVGTATASCDPVLMLTAGQAAIEKVLARHDVHPDDVAAYEFAESFGALCVKLQRDLRIDDERMNIYGGTLAAGHAPGATGVILLGNLVQALEERGGRFGVAAVSGAAGVGCAVLLERV